MKKIPLMGKSWKVAPGHQICFLEILIPSCTEDPLVHIPGTAWTTIKVQPAVFGMQASGWVWGRRASVLSQSESSYHSSVFCSYIAYEMCIFMCAKTIFLPIYSQKRQLSVAEKSTLTRELHRRVGSCRLCEERSILSTLYIQMEAQAFEMF